MSLRELWPTPSSKTRGKIEIEPRSISREASVRDRVLKISLVVIGSLFVLLAIPGVMFFSREPAVAMIMSLYVPMGVFLLLSVRSPSAHRSLIAYAGWANVAHAAVMAVQEVLNVIERRELIGEWRYSESSEWRWLR
jgi:hypothetical protein